MAIPDFQSFLLPILRFAGDGLEHSLVQSREHVAQEFHLTDVELSKLLPSGKQTTFANRITWAKVYLCQAGLLTPTKRAHFVISDDGRQVLGQNLDRIDVKFLKQYPSFTEFHAGKRDGGGESPQGPDGGDTQTPEEALEAAYSGIQASLSIDLLTRVKAASPAYFEQVVVELLLQMGYGGSRADAGRAIGKSGDEGIDGVINEDRLGLDAVYIQAKKWEGTVGRPEVQKFVGALHGKRARKGVLITTGKFSADAIAYVEHIDPRVVLIDGQRLTELMIDFEVGVSTTRTFHIKRVDMDYFEEL